MPGSIGFPYRQVTARTTNSNHHSRSISRAEPLLTSLGKSEDGVEVQAAIFGMDADAGGQKSKRGRDWSSQPLSRFQGVKVNLVEIQKPRQHDLTGYPMINAKRRDIEECSLLRPAKSGREQDTHTSSFPQGVTGEMTSRSKEYNSRDNLTPHKDTRHPPPEMSRAVAW